MDMDAASEPVPHVDNDAEDAPAVVAGVGGVVGGVSTNLLTRAVRTLLGEHAVCPDEARTDGAGLLLAEAAVGVAHGLHSRAPRILNLAFGQDLVRVEDFHRLPAGTGTQQGASFMVNLRHEF
jgi:U3 small nucleolar RNA-associated protein 20